MQSRKGDKGRRHGAHVDSFAREVIIEWNNRQDKLTVPVDYATNVATFALAPGYKSYQAFAEAAELGDDLPPLVMDATVVSDDNDTIASDEHHPDQDDWNDDGWTGSSEGDGILGLSHEPTEVTWTFTPEDQASNI